MIVRNLDNQFNEIMSCFFAAFENYFVKMPTDLEYYRQRWTSAKVDFKLSYGMFNDGKLVGFIINAIDKRNGQLTAYNTGTGVMPEYRGQKVVKSIYDFALLDLKKNGVAKCSLEVIQDNLIAIKSYKRIGFKVSKRYKCFQGKLAIPLVDDGFLHQLEKKDINWSQMPDQENYSWDNQKETVLNGDYKFYQVIYSGIIESFFVINSVNGYLAQFNSIVGTENSWIRLFSKIQTISDNVTVINVDERRRDKVAFLTRFGLKNTVNQYHMELKNMD